MSDAITMDTPESLAPAVENVTLNQTTEAANNNEQHLNQTTNPPATDESTKKTVDTHLTPLSLEKEFTLAKAFLKQQQDPNSNTNLYDHLSHVLLKLLQKQPTNGLDILESLSLDVKRSQFMPENVESPAALLKTKEPTIRLKKAELNKELLKFFKEEKIKNEAFTGDIPDMLELANLFEWAGVSVGREEMFLIFASIKKLVMDRGLKSARLFGKMLGTRRDYIIVESERREDEPEDEETAENQAGNNANDINQGQPPVLENPDEQDIPKPKLKPNINTAAVPKEQGTGVNKYVYWVCNGPGEEWRRLPDAKPAHINASKSIRKLLTGQFDHPMNTYPPFNGTEAHYLRALIARIAAATVLSPTGYYKFDDEEEAADGEVRSVVLNTEFEWPAQESLTALDAWCHHVPYILPQGRTVWVNPLAKDENDDGAGKDDEEGEEEAAIEPETGPSVLSPASEDADLGGDVTAWTIRLASPLSPTRYSPVFLRSNRWPGAYTVGYNDKFANVYVGWGVKDLTRPYLPPALGEVQFEYGTEQGPGKPDHVTEQADPSVDDEKVFAQGSAGEDGGAKDEEEDA